MRVSVILEVHIHEFKTHTTTTKSDVHIHEFENCSLKRFAHKGMHAYNVTISLPELYVDTLNNSIIQANREFPILYIISALEKPLLNFSSEILRMFQKSIQISLKRIIEQIKQEGGARQKPRVSCCFHSKHHTKPLPFDRLLFGTLIIVARHYPSTTYFTLFPDQDIPAS